MADHYLERKRSIGISKLELWLALPAGNRVNNQRKWPNCRRHFGPFFHRHRHPSHTYLEDDPETPFWADFVVGKSFVSEAEFSTRGLSGSSSRLDSTLPVRPIEVFRSCRRPTTIRSTLHIDPLKGRAVPRRKALGLQHHTRAGAGEMKVKIAPTRAQVNRTVANWQPFG